MACAGQLRERVTIQELVLSSDGFGGFEKSWIDYATTWAMVKPVARDETVEYGQLKAENVYEVTIRYDNAIDEKFRIVWGSKNLDILSITNPDLRRKYTAIICRLKL